MKRITTILAAVLLAALGRASCAAADGIVDDPYVLAKAAVRTGEPIDGIAGGAMVDNAYHVHAHLTIFVDGREWWVPAGVGVVPPVFLDPARPDPVIKEAMAFYALHTHDESGVIHAEAAEPQDFTLGQFFDIWGQPLRFDRVGPSWGTVTVYVDGQKVKEDPRNVVIRNKTMIQLDVGQDVPFKYYYFPPQF